MTKDITKNILEAKINLKKEIASIKGLSEYSEHNQELLLKTFDKKKHRKIYFYGKKFQKEDLYNDVKW
jgi:hypothetical protein